MHASCMHGVDACKSCIVLPLVVAFFHVLRSLRSLRNEKMPPLGLEIEIIEKHRNMQIPYPYTVPLFSRPLSKGFTIGIPLKHRKSEYYTFNAK